MTSHYLVSGGKFERESNIVSGTPAWQAARVGLTIGSSQAAAVFNGISTTSTKGELLRSFRGEAPVPPRPFALKFMDEGKRMEPVLRAEAADLLAAYLGVALVTYVPCQFIGETHFGVQERSSPDLVCLSVPCLRTCLVEIKWRIGDKDCGWGTHKDKESRCHLGLTVWCQVQHQMHVTGIHSAFVYSGSTVARRLWHVSYCHVFRQLWFLPALQTCAEYGGKGGPGDHTAEKLRPDLYTLLKNTSTEITLNGRSE